MGVTTRVDFTFEVEDDGESRTRDTGFLLTGLNVLVESRLADVSPNRTGRPWFTYLNANR